MPTPGSRSSTKHGRNTPGCGERRIPVIVSSLEPDEWLKEDTWKAWFCVSLGKLQTLNPPQPADHWVPTGAVLVHHPSLMNAGEGCRAVASRPRRAGGPVAAFERYSKSGSGRAFARRHFEGRAGAVLFWRFEVAPCERARHVVQHRPNRSRHGATWLPRSALHHQRFAAVTGWKRSSQLRVSLINSTRGIPWPPS